MASAHSGRAGSRWTDLRYALPDGKLLTAARPRLRRALRSHPAQDAAHTRARRPPRDRSRGAVRSVAARDLEAPEGARARRADPAPAPGLAPSHPAAHGAAAQGVKVARVLRARLVGAPSRAAGAAAGGMMPEFARRLGPRIGWTLLVLGALLAALNAVLFMTVPAVGSPEFKERFLAASLAGWIHTLGGALAALIGPFQLWPGSRARWRRTHVWLGRCYVIAVASSGLAGLFFAQTSVGGTAGRVGFSSLAVLWLSSVALAYAAIRRGAGDEHRRWML